MPKPTLRSFLLSLGALCAIASAALPAAAETTPFKPARPARSATVAATPEGYRVAKTPDWVKPIAATPSPAAAPASPSGYRYLLVDLQTQLAVDGGPQAYTRVRSVATDSTGVPIVAKVEIHFDPAYQTLTLHDAAVLRDGLRTDRLKGARIELLRREEGLERDTLTGMRTLVIVMNDVRVGDATDVSYTVQGENPIFKGHFARSYELGYPAPAQQVQMRITAPTGRTLHTRVLRGDFVPETFVEGGRQVVRVVRRDVPAVVNEEGVPPWHKVYPAIHVSDYADWQAVAAWADDLFANPGELGPDLTARLDAWRARNLPRDQLASEVATFVQDEVRYFSASLGESSHRPKQPARTYAERLGDCKDKVALLDAMLRALGFDARPALISTYRNRGIANYLPSHDQFDHVITRLELDGNIYWIDATAQKQGHRLATRGFLAYGQTLVVDPRSTSLTPLQGTATQVDALEFDQTWDVSQLQRPVQFTSIMRARGRTAEQWRNFVAATGTERIVGSLAGAYARLMPGLRSSGDPTVRDDLEANVFELEMHYALPSFGQYERGVLAVEVPALEILDSLTGPREAQRELPWLIDQPRRVKQSLRLVAPRRFGGQAPAPVEVGDPHFGVGVRYALDNNVLNYEISYERRADEVMPAALSGYRERVQRARKLVGVTARLPLLDVQSLRPDLTDLERRLARTWGSQVDTLREIVQREELERLFATETLKRAGDNTALIGEVLNKRAIANSMLDDAQGALDDSDRVLALAPEIGYANYTRGLALMSLGRSDDAIAAMRRYQNPPDRALLDSGIGGAQYYGGHYDEARQTFDQVVRNSSGTERLFSLAWLYIAAERSGGQGKAALAPYLASVDKAVWPGIVLHCLAGEATPEQVLSAARSDKRMERLNLAEAYFYLGQQLLLASKTDEAKRMFQRTVDLHATPYREHAYAELELKRGATP